MGPAATAEEWRANARQGHAVHATLFWSRRWERPKVISFLVKKGGDYTMRLLMKALEELESRGLLVALEHLVHWSDGAPSYRSRSALSYMVAHIPMRFKLSTVAKFGARRGVSRVCFEGGVRPW